MMLSIKKQFLNILNDFNFIKHLFLCVISKGENGDTIRELYTVYFVDIIGICLRFKETLILFDNNEEIIIDTLMNIICNKNETKWLRSSCSHQLKLYITMISELEVDSNNYNYNPSIVISPIPNALTLLLPRSLTRLHSFIPKLCDLIINNEDYFNRILVNSY